MKDWKVSINDVLNVAFCCLLVCHLCMLYGLSTMQNSIISLCSMGIFAMGAILFGGTVIYKVKIGIREAVLFTLLITIVLIIVDKDIKSETLMLASGYVMMLTVWVSAKNIVLWRFSKSFITIMFVLVGGFLIMQSYSEYAYIVRNNDDYVTEALTLGFSNSNQTAIIVYSTISVLIIQFDRIEKKFLKYIILAEAIWLFYLLVLTDARTCILACVFVVLMKFANKLKLTELRLTRVNNGMILFICILPLLFYWVYTYLYDSRILAGVEFMGKDLFSGRNEVYNRSIDMWKNKLFGNMELFSFENTHNASLTIILNTGLVGYLLYLTYTYMELSEINKNGRLNFLPMIVLLSFFVMGCSETAILVSGSIYYIMMLTVCVLANDTTE